MKFYLPTEGIICEQSDVEEIYWNGIDWSVVIGNVEFEALPLDSKEVLALIKKGSNVIFDKDYAEKLAEKHWQYIEGILKKEGTPEQEINRIGYHYKTAFVHGYKHAIERINELSK